MEGEEFERQEALLVQKMLRDVLMLQMGFSMHEKPWVPWEYRFETLGDFLEAICASPLRSCYLLLTEEPTYWVNQEGRWMKVILVLQLSEEIWSL